MLQKLKQIRSSISGWINERRADHQCESNCPKPSQGDASDGDNSQENASQDSPADQGIMKSLIGKLKRLQNATGERANQLAESLAKQISAWSGKNVTADDVKKGARNGAIVGMIAALFLMANRSVNNSGASPLSQLVQGAQNNPRTSGDGGGAFGYAAVPHYQQSEEEFLEQCRIEDDHLDYVRQEEQQQYYDQMQDFADDQVSYNDY